jgi:hypothetical protein
MNRILNAIARWYFRHYLKPLIEQHLKVHGAQEARSRYIGG